MDSYFTLQDVNGGDHRQLVFTLQDANEGDHTQLVFCIAGCHIKEKDHRKLVFYMT